MCIFVDHLQTYGIPQLASLVCLALVPCTQCTAADLAASLVEHSTSEDVRRICLSQSARAGYDLTCMN